MELNVYKIDGTKLNEKIELSNDVFGIEPNEHVVYLDIKAILANARQGTHKTKTRSEVSGGGKKPFRQKGTGNARQGTIRAPHMPGGGRAFGPRPRDYSQNLPKKVKALARRSALSDKVKFDKVLIVEDFTFEEAKTKNAVNIINSFNLKNDKVMFVTKDYDKNFILSVQNIHGANTFVAPEFSTYDVVNANVIVFQKSAVTKVNEVLG